MFFEAKSLPFVVHVRGKDTSGFLSARVVLVTFVTFESAIFFTGHQMVQFDGE